MMIIGTDSRLMNVSHSDRLRASRTDANRKSPSVAFGQLSPRVSSFKIRRPLASLKSMASICGVGVLHACHVILF
jgi:hypothetical protein